LPNPPQSFRDAEQEIKDMMAGKSSKPSSSSPASQSRKEMDRKVEEIMSGERSSDGKKKAAPATKKKDEFDDVKLGGSPKKKKTPAEILSTPEDQLSAAELARLEVIRLKKFNM